MLRGIVAILAGLLLLADSLGKFRGLGNLIRGLRPYQTVIGVVALVAGVMSFFSLLGITLILAGVILGTNALVTVPRVGDEFGGAGRALAPFAALIGGVALLLGLMSLL